MIGVASLTVLLVKLVIFVVLLAVGYVGARQGTLNSGFTKGASSLLVNIFLTSSILSSVLGEDRPQMSVGDMFYAFLITTLLLVICYAVAIAVSRTIYRKHKQSPQIELCIAVMNNLFLGIPVMSASVGSIGVFYIGLSCISFNLVLYTYGVWRLVSGTSGAKIKLSDVITPPLIAGILAGAIFAFDISLPYVLTELINTVAAGTVPISMIIIGATLGKVSIKDAFTDKVSYVISFFSLIVCPIVTWYLLTPLTQNNLPLREACMIMAACPVAAVLTPISVKYGKDPLIVSKSIMVSTVLSMITLPLLIKIFCNI